MDIAETKELQSVNFGMLQCGETKVAFGESKVDYCEVSPDIITHTLLLKVLARLDEISAIIQKGK